MALGHSGWCKRNRIVAAPRKPRQAGVRKSWGTTVECDIFGSGNETLKDMTGVLQKGTISSEWSVTESKIFQDKKS